MKWNIVLTILAGLLVAGMLWYAFAHGAQIAVMNPQGPIALHERGVIIATVLLSMIVVIPVFIMLFSFAWNFRATSKNADRKHSPTWDHDSWWTTEIMWWIVPTIIVVILGFIMYKSTHELDPYVRIPSSNPTIEVQVVALDWKWLFIYPQQGIATVNILEFPVNTPVHFDITSDAPMNTFWIPSLGGQIMTMPGMSTQLNLMATSLGTFKGLSGNISGEGFAGMTFDAKSVSESDFNAWISGIQSQANPLTADTYATLAKPTQYVAPMYYSSVAPELYTGTVMKYMMPNMATTTTATAKPEPAPAAPAMSDMQGMDMSAPQQ